MHFASLTAIALTTFSILANCTPYQIQNGKLQQSRRRAVDYPVQKPAESRRALRERRVNYSVVPVNGASPTTNEAATATIIKTITTDVSTPSETIIVTTTEKIPALTTFEVPRYTMPSETVKTVERTVLETVTPTSSTKYYDDGMWHTRYPVKSWTTMWSNDADATVAPRAAAPTGAVAPVASARVVRREARLPRRFHSPAAQAEAGELTRTEFHGVKRFMKK